MWGVTLCADLKCLQQWLHVLLFPLHAQHNKYCASKHVNINIWFDPVYKHPVQQLSFNSVSKQAATIAYRDNVQCHADRKCHENCYIKYNLIAINVVVHTLQFRQQSIHSNSPLFLFKNTNISACSSKNRERRWDCTDVAGIVQNRRATLALAEYNFWCVFHHCYTSTSDLPSERLMRDMRRSHSARRAVGHHYHSTATAHQMPAVAHAVSPRGLSIGYWFSINSASSTFYFCRFSNRFKRFV